ncbi:MAG: 50S ribosomal protein L27 [Candidatus Nomurabacteria bacterium]|nr:MAG: 50S ribosomal protein L27 [Candidatus Nomurabacteria bacterium]
MAHTKSGGSTSLGRDSAGQRLGMKRFSGQRVRAGEVLVRQRGTHLRPGVNVRRGNDDTLYAVTSGTVQVKQRKVRLFNNKLVARRYVSIQAE